MDTTRTTPRTTTRVVAGLIIATGVALGGGGGAPMVAHAAHVDAHHLPAPRSGAGHPSAPDLSARAPERLRALRWHPSIVPPHISPAGAAGRGERPVLG